MSQAYRSRRLARWTGLVVAAALLAPVAGTAAFAQTPPSPEGLWYTKNNESIIRVHPCADEADAMCGTLAWMKEPNDKNGQPKIDTLNRDASKKGRPMLGVDILLPMRPDTDHWKGKAYNPEDGKTYDITFKVQADNSDAADLRGCILSFLCQTQVFNRAPEVPGGDPTLAADAAAGHKHKGKRDLKTSAHR